MKTIQLLCIFKLSARLAKAEARKTLCFRNPSTIAGYYMEEMRHLSQEHMKLLMLDTKSNLIAEKEYLQRNCKCIIGRTKRDFCGGGKKEAVSIILLHNHPSGDPTQAKRMWRLLGG